MRRFLLLISLLLPISVVGEPCRTTVTSTGSATGNTAVTEPVVCLGSPTIEVTASAERTDTTESSYLFPFSDNETTRYTVAITYKNASFSGICVVKRMDGIIAGSMVNEFGIRAFDFKMSGNRRRVKLLNVMKPLDKCLIRKTIARDLKRLFSVTSVNEYVSMDGDKIIMRRPNRSYTFSKMNIPE